MDTFLTLLTIASCFTLAVTVWVYDRHIAELRAERDEAVADCDLFSQMLLDNAVAQHPSSRRLRAVK